MKIIPSDNGTKFMCLSAFFREKGTHQASCVSTPQQNGRVDRKHIHMRSQLFRTLLHLVAAHKWKFTKWMLAMHFSMLAMKGRFTWNFLLVLNTHIPTKCVVLGSLFMVLNRHRGVGLKSYWTRCSSLDLYMHKMTTPCFHSYKRVVLHVLIYFDDLIIIGNNL